ncbi:MAG: galactose oxidase-like domain-containing protein, partial [Acidimicrobiia bacterium]
LADGKVLVAGGLSRVINGAESSQLRRTETYDPATDVWTENYAGPGSESTLPLQPRLFLTPNNKVFYNAGGQGWGPYGQAADEAFYGFQQFFDPETKQWEMVSRPSLGARSGAAQVPLMMDPPFDQMTILTFGGTMGPSPGSGAAVNTATLTTVDRSGNIANSDTGDLDRARTFASGVLLPDGSVLAIGGADTDDALAPGSGVAVHSSEQYNPFKREWIEVADHTRDRDYHSSAVLLPDMRVLLGGHAPAPSEAQSGGRGVFSNRDPDPSFEIYSPRYLFRGPRPVITGLQAGIAYREQFRIRTEEPDAIAGVVLLRIGSPQHAVDSDQRSLRLEFRRTGSTTLEAIAPPDGVAAPPGYYYLVLIKQNLRGAVPSVARIVHVGETPDYGEAIQPFPDESAIIAVGQAEPAEDHSQAAALRRIAGETIGDVKYAVPEDPFPTSGPIVRVSDREGFLDWPGHRRLAVPY